MGGDGENDDPPPIAPYPFWQQGRPRPAPAPRPLPATGEQPAQAFAPAPDDAATQAFAAAPDDAATQAFAAAPDDAPTQAFAAAPDDAPTQAYDALGEAPTQAHDFSSPAHDFSTPAFDSTAAASPPSRARARATAPAVGPRGSGPSQARAPRPTTLLGVLAVIVVATVLFVGVRTVLGGRGETEDSAAPQPTASAAPLPGGDPDDLAEMTPEAARSALREAGESDDADVEQALSWRDDNGRNAVVTTQEPSSRGRTTLRVVHVAGLGDDADALRVMRDPDLPVCSSDNGPGEAAFTPGSLIVRDLDGDGTAEVITGWSSRCATGPSAVRLALLSDGDKYILRGDGVIGTRDSGTTDPDPASSSWPTPYFATLTTLFDRLYY